MQNRDKTRDQLIGELAGLHYQITELEALEAGRREISESLLEFQKEYYNFFKESRDALYITNRDGRFVEANQSFLNLLGYTREELANLRAQETYANYRDRQRFQRDIEQRGFVVDYAIRLRKKDGTERDCLASATVRRGNDGSILGYQGIIRDITEHMRMEEALRESEEKFRMFIETASDLMGITDNDLRFTYVNDSMARTLGYSKQEMSGMHVSQLLRKEDVKKDFKQKKKELVAAGGIIFETIWIAKGGKEIHGELKVAAIYDKDGKFTGTTGVFRDITERKKSEEKLWKAKERFRSLVEATSDLIWEVDQNGVHTYVSPNVKDLLGYEWEEVIGKSYFDLMPPDEAERVSPIFRNIKSSQRPFERLENVNLHKDGRRIVLETSGVPIFDENGNLSGYRGIDRDITERKQMERSLQESKLHYRALFESAPVGIGIATFDGVVLAANKAMCQITNYSEADMGKLNVRDAYENPEQRTLLLKRLQRGEVVQDLEVKLKRKDGTFYYADLTIKPITLNGEDVLLTIQRDITDRKEAEQRLRDYQDRLRSLASKMVLAEEGERRRIASYLHDDIGHTLAMCKIKLGSLRGSLASAGHDAYFEEVYRLIEQAIQCTRSLTFELSPPVLYELGLGAAVEWLVEKIKVEHGILIDFKNDAQLKVMDDNVKILLFQATRELLTNVIKHAQAQNVKVSMRRYDDKIRIDVEDDGVGFNASQALSNLGNNVGFGLFDIRERLSYMGGNLEIRSEPGCGTLAIIAAPLKFNKKIRKYGEY